MYAYVILAGYRAWGRAMAWDPVEVLFFLGLSQKMSEKPWGRERRFQSCEIRSTISPFYRWTNMLKVTQLGSDGAENWQPGLLPPLSTSIGNTATAERMRTKPIWEGMPKCS